MAFVGPSFSCVSYNTYHLLVGITLCQKKRRRRTKDHIYSPKREIFFYSTNYYTRTEHDVLEYKIVLTYLLHNESQ